MKNGSISICASDRARQLPSSSVVPTYLAVGAISTAVHYTVMSLLMWLSVGPLFATGIGAFFGLVTGYYLNSKFTFQRAGVSATRFAKYALVGLLIVIVNGVVLSVGMGLMALSVWASQIIATSVATAVGYTVNSRWSFKS